jgi:hypothetical protein
MQYTIRLGLGGGDFYIWETEAEDWMRPACSRNYSWINPPSMTAVYGVYNKLQQETSDSFSLSSADEVFCQSITTHVNVKIQKTESGELSTFEFEPDVNSNTVQTGLTLIGASNSTAKKVKFDSTCHTRFLGDKLVMGLLDYWHGWSSSITVETDMTPVELENYISTNISFMTHRFVIAKTIENFIVKVELPLGDRIHIVDEPEATLAVLWNGTPESTSGRGKEYLISLPYGNSLEGKDFVEKVRKRPKVEWLQ